MDAVSDWLGASPADVAESLRRFARSSELISNDRQLVDKYAQKWVGACAGEVQAAADDLDTLLQVLDGKGVPRAETAIRFIEREQGTLIL